MSARYIPATTAEVIDKLNLIVERTNSPAEILECLFEILQSDGGWGNRLEDLFKRYRSFWALIGLHTLQKLDKRHQAMFALVAKHEEGWEQTFLEIVCDTKRYTPETRALFAVFVIGPLTPHLSHPVLFQEAYCKMILSHDPALGPLSPFPCPFNSDTFCARLSKSYERKMPCDLMNAITTDDIAQFEIQRTLQNRAFTISLVKTLFKHGACKILAHHIDTTEAFIDPKDILFSCASTLPSSCICLIKALESRHPGIVANARDIFGNNALWYGLHRLGQNRCAPEVEKHLIELGCDPESSNLLDLSYASMLKAKDIFKTI